MKALSGLLLTICALAVVSSCGTVATTATQTATATQIETATQFTSTTHTLTATQSVTNTQTVTITNTVTTTVCLNSTVPDDFYIIYTTSWDLAGYNGMVLLDTKNNIIGNPLGPPDVYASTDFFIPCNDLQTIYDAIIEYDIKSYSTLNPSTFPPVTPTIDFEITFCLEGNIYLVKFTNLINSLSWSYPDLAAFVRLLNDYYRNTDECKSLPPASWYPY